MEIATPPPPPPPPQEFRFDSALLDDAYHADSSPSRNPFAFAPADDANPFLATALTAPPSPNPFGLLPPDDAAGGDPFDLFQHFASAPASPARVAAIYAQFSGVHDDGADRDDDKQDDSFQPRASYSTRTVASAVPFDWEERPGKPKHGYASIGATVAGGDGEAADFDFGVLLDRGAQKAPALTTSDQLFDEGKIRPLKPPPRLLDSGSVGSSPRSARSARSAMWSPRLRGIGGPGPDFDPFAAAMANASKAPALSPLGAGADAAIDAGTDTVPMSPEPVASPRSVPPTASNSGGRKKWRLSDLLLFRRLSAKGRASGNISREPVFKYSPVQHLGMPVEKTAAEPVGVGGDASAIGNKQKQQQRKYVDAAPGAGDGSSGMAAARQKHSLMGCVRLNPGLHRLAKGLNVSSTSHFGRHAGAARSAAMHG